MILVGYIREFKEVMFTIPIYTNGESYYFHILDNYYNINGFEEISGTIENFIKLDSDLEFEDGEKGAIVFRGKGDFIIYDRLIVGISKVRRYFNREIKLDEFVHAKQDVQYFESLIINSKKNKEKEVVQLRRKQKEVNLNSLYYILTYLKQDIQKEELNDNYESLITLMYDKVLNSENKKVAVVEFKNSVGRKQSSRRGLMTTFWKPRLNGVKKKGIRFHFKKYITKRTGFSDKVIFLKSIIEEVMESEKSIH